jgi:hypothetical protein
VFREWLSELSSHFCELALARRSIKSPKL